MITYLQGDATHPIGDGPKIIMHVCNDRGGWGAGFTGALSRRWSEPENSYRIWFRDNAVFGTFRLGEHQVMCVEKDVFVVNMIAQRGYATGHGIPLDYAALYQCLRDVAYLAKIGTPSTVHAPRIGCGLAGGTWDKVEPLIVEAFGDVPVFIYDLPGERP